MELTLNSQIMFDIIVSSFMIVFQMQKCRLLLQNEAKMNTNCSKQISIDVKMTIRKCYYWLIYNSFVLFYQEKHLVASEHIVVNARFRFSQVIVQNVWKLLFKMGTIVFARDIFVPRVHSFQQCLDSFFSFRTNNEFILKSHFHSI